MYKAKHISVIVPAYNEALAISKVLMGLKNLHDDSGQKIIDEIIVCDNASTDNTGEIARVLKASVVKESQAGYGAACLRALSEIKHTDIVLFVDADASVDPLEIPTLLEEIYNGADLVIGKRVRSLQGNKALVWQQRFGTQLACKFINLLYKTKVSDLGPLRAIRFNTLKQFNMQDTRFGWTAEMQVKAIQAGVKMIEVPVSVRTRIGVSKISGTLRGTILAGYDILSTIWSLWKDNKNPSFASVQSSTK